MNTIVKQLFVDALEANSPSNLINDWVSLQGSNMSVGAKEWTIGEKQDLYVLAVGKASRPMAKALKNKLDVSSSHILCITPETKGLEKYCFSSTHPIPDIKSRKAADKLISFAEQIPSDSLVIFALSGGASALVCKPADDINLPDMNTVNKMLLESGANIEEVNSVRKHLSEVKGGQLLSYLRPDCTLIDLVISDVPNDNLEIIGSGLTTPDSSTFQDAYDTLLRYELWEKLPENIQGHIEKGLTGEVPETIKPGHDPIANHTSFIIGSAKKFADTIAEMAADERFNTWVAEKPFNQPVDEVTKMVADRIKRVGDDNKDATVMVFYGESTVNVTGGGKGGRNQELALRGALEIEGMEGVTWLSAGTDGVDGPTDAAGARVDGSTIARAKEKGLNVEKFISENDSYHFHEQVGTLLKTGPTGNNIMDIVIVLVE